MRLYLRRRSRHVLFLLTVAALCFLWYLYQLSAVNYFGGANVERLGAFSPRRRTWQQIQPIRSSRENTTVRTEVYTTSTLADRNTPLSFGSKVNSSVSVANQRALQLRATCAHNVTGTRNAGRRRLIIDHGHRMAYCPIEKVGSSFWKRVFAILNRAKGSVVHSNVFDMSGVKIHRQHTAKTMPFYKFLSNNSLTHSYKKFLFVRDPYERLFSGFVDKIFTPTFETAALSRSMRGHSRRSHSRRDFRKNRFFQRHLQWLKDDVNSFMHSFNWTSKALVTLLGTKDHSDRMHSVSKSKIITIGGKRNETLINQQVRKGNINLTSRAVLPVPLRPDLHRNMLRNKKQLRHLEIHPLRPDDLMDYYDEYEDTDLNFGTSGEDYHSQFSRRRDLCAFDVTFEEFVHYVINGLNVNEHFRPMSVRCPPCALAFDFVGKLETFQEDVSAILKSADVDPNDVMSSDSRFAEDSDKNIMSDVIKRTFANVAKYKACMSKRKMLLRTWTTFQIRGFLSIDQSFPLETTIPNTVTADEFIKVVNEAYDQSGPRELRMRQRKAAMMEAYSRLPRPLLQNLQFYTHRDCQLFGYECSVNSRFPVNHRPKPVFFPDYVNHAEEEEERR